MLVPIDGNAECRSPLMAMPGVCSALDFSKCLTTSHLPSIAASCNKARSLHDDTLRILEVTQSPPNQ